MGQGVSGNQGNLFTVLGDAVFTPVSEVKKWSWTMKANVGKYSSNKTGGYKKSVAGTKEGSGSADCILDPEDPPSVEPPADAQTVAAGALLSLALQTVSGQLFIVPCVIANIKVDVDLDSGDPETWSFDWEANEAWENPEVVGLLAGPTATPVPGVAGGYTESPEDAKGIGRRLGTWRRGMPEPETLAQHLKRGNFPGAASQSPRQRQRPAGRPQEYHPWRVEEAVRLQSADKTGKVRLDVPEGVGMDQIVLAVMEVLGKRGG
jgi:hypothetical protein